jgi:hypothetical protein
MYSVSIKHPALEHGPGNAYPVEYLREWHAVQTIPISELESTQSEHREYE